MGPRGFWIAFAIVLFYLIARPHIGHVWYVNADQAKPPAPSDLWYVSADQAKPSAPLPSPTPLPSPPATKYATERECGFANARFYNATRADGTYCASENALLWGW